MRLRLLLFLLLPSVCYADDPTILGYLCKTTWAAYVVTESTNPQTGQTTLTGSYSGSTYTLIKFYPSSSTTAPTLGQLGFTEYCQIDGSPLPKDSWGNPSQLGTFYLCQPAMQAYPVKSSAPSDFINALGNLNTPHTIGPIYNSDAGLPFVVNDYGNASGFNNDFRPQQVVQGDSGDKYIVYNINGQPFLSDTNNGYIWVNDGNGNWQLQQQISPDTPESGTIDLTPVVSAIDGVQQKQDLQRQTILDLLAANGNSWVYDCKLSLDDLKSLATSLGLKLDSQSTVQSSINGNVSTINGNVSTIESQVRTSATRLQNMLTVLNAINTVRLSPMQTDLSDLKTSVASIDSKLPDGSETVPVLPSPVLPSDSPDDSLPLYLQSFNWDVSTPLATLQGWTSETGLLKFGLGSLDDWLSRFISIPSVGSDPHMFSIDFDIPYLGHIQRDFSFADWPTIPLFRQVALYALYLFFGLAIYKLIHKTLQ